MLAYIKREWSEIFFQKINSYAKPWRLNAGALSESANIVWDTVLKHPEYPWDYLYMSLNPNITWEIVDANPDKPWSYYHLLLNPNITWQIVRKNIDKFSKPGVFAGNPNLTWDIVVDNPDIHWDYWFLSRNPNITWEIIQANPEKNWSKKTLTCNPNVTLQIIKNHPEIDWPISWFSLNPNFRLEDFAEHFPEKINNLESVFHDEFPISYPITLEVYQKYPQLFRYRKRLAESPSISLETIKADPDLCSIPSFVENNPNLTWEFLTIYPAGIVNEHGNLARNPMRLEKQKVVSDCIRKWFAAKKIKTWFVSRFWQPDTYLGYKRLQASYLQDDYSVWS